jgi:hypothetical protein
MAFEIEIISTNAGVPSCIRVPPEQVATSSGRRSRVARRTADAHGGGVTDRTAEERELTRDHRDAGAVDRARARHDRLVDARPFPRRRELLRVLRVEAREVYRFVPADEGVAQDELDQVDGPHAHHAEDMIVPWVSRAVCATRRVIAGSRITEWPSQ